MNKHKNYHMYSLLAIVILILVIIFLIIYIGRRNTTGSSNNIIKNAGDDSDVSSYLKEQNVILSDMMENMSVKESGSAELDFLISLIPHSEAGIELTKNYLKYGGKNSKLKKLAYEIIEEHSGEINEMRTLVKEIENLYINNKEKESAYLDSYNKMISSHKDIQNEIEAAENVEAAYIEVMIIHNQMAVDMAKAILENTWHDEIRDIAEDIIEMQKEEIGQMEKIFNDM